jgi:hypothetical protein
LGFAYVALANAPKVGRYVARASWAWARAAASVAEERKQLRSRPLRLCEPLALAPHARRERGIDTLVRRHRLRIIEVEQCAKPALRRRALGSGLGERRFSA